MFHWLDPSRRVQELNELDRLLDENLEQVLEQRRVLATLGVGGKANVVTGFLEELLLARQIYIADRESLLMGLR